MLQLTRGVKLAALASILCAPSLLAQSSAAPPPKFAFVDSRAILDRAPGASDVSAVLDKERSASQAKLSKMQDTLTTMIAAFNKEQAGLADSVRTKRAKAIQDKQAEYQRKADDMEQQFQARQNELVQPIMLQIRETLEKLRQEEGYTMIFDVGQTGVIVAADKNLDITDRVVARLKPVSVNVTSKSDSTKAAGTKATPAGVTPPKKPPTS